MPKFSLWDVYQRQSDTLWGRPGTTLPPPYDPTPELHRWRLVERVIAGIAILILAGGVAALWR
jgi:hypothetical protein